MPRKTQAQRDNEWYEADRRVWDAFKPRLASLGSFEEAKELISKPPSPDAPGRRYYSNLGFFLQSFVVPHDSNAEERALYVHLIERLDKAGELKAGAAADIIEALHVSMGSS